ncbi:MAG TPA: hypothetical protein VIY27_02575 [Myxococcota bacterium]
MDHQPQLFMDPYGRVVDATGALVQVPQGLVPVPVGPPTVEASAESAGWLAREVGGVPLWGVILGVAALGGGGYYLFTRAKASVNDPADEAASGGSRSRSRSSGAGTVRLTANAGSSGGEEAPTRSRSRWAPSRARVAERAQKWLTERNKANGVVVYPDADEALAKGIKNPSPLLNLRVKRNEKLHEDAEFQKWARREGLNPVRIDQTTVGLVPAENTKRGSQWESYVDALRDEGQKV